MGSRPRWLRRALALGLAACVVAVACNGDDRSASEATPGPAGAPPTALLYVDRTTLYSYDLESGAATRVAELPSADVAVSPDGSRYVYVADRAPAAEPDVFGDPVLFVETLEDVGEPAMLGPGRSPLWSPDGERVAAIVPIPAVEGCPEESEEAPPGCFRDHVVVYEPGTEEPRAVFPHDRWSLLGWTDDEVAAIGALEERVVIGGRGEIVTVPYEPSQVWGISPTGRRLLLTDAGAAVVADETGFGAVVTIDLSGRRIGDGAWSPDGERIAAVLLDQTAQGLDSSLAILTPASATIAEVPDSNGAQGGVVWSSAGDSFAYVRAASSRGDKLEALLCTGDSPSCEPTFSWREGVRLLALI